MRSLMSWGAAAAVCLAVSLPAMAQQPGGPGRRPGGPGGFGGGGGMRREGIGTLGLLNLPPVQKKLKLSDDQKKKLDDLQDKMQAKMREMFAGGPGGPGGFGGRPGGPGARPGGPGGRPGGPGGPGGRPGGPGGPGGSGGNFAALREMREKSDAEALAVLKDGQKKEFTKIQKTAQDYQPLGRAGLALLGVSGISEDQSEKLKKLGDDTASKRRSLFQGAQGGGTGGPGGPGGFSGVREKLQELDEQTSKQVRALLNGSQQAQFDANLKELPQGRGMGMGRGFGGFGGPGGPGGRPGRGGGAARRPGTGT